MLSIAHAVTGAYLAVKVSNPYLAVPLIILSHFLEDAVSHWDAGTGLGKGLKTPREAFYHELVDLALAALLVFIFFPDSFPIINNSKLEINNFAPIWGSFLALLPDFLEAPRNFFKYEPKWLAPINKFHGLFHHSIPRVVDGLAPQILLLVILYLTK